MFRHCFDAPCNVNIDSKTLATSVRLQQASSSYHEQLTRPFSTLGSRSSAEQRSSRSTKARQFVKLTEESTRSTGIETDFDQFNVLFVFLHGQCITVTRLPVGRQLSNHHRTAQREDNPMHHRRSYVVHLHLKQSFHRHSKSNVFVVRRTQHTKLSN
jgi:hypothetical protein